MDVPENAICLRIYIGERDRHNGRPLHDAIVKKARAAHLAGATVLRGAMGYGHSSRLHRASFLEISEDLPLIIEIVDSRDKIDAFLPVLDGMMGSGLVTLEKVQVLRYGNGAPAAPTV